MAAALQARGVGPGSTTSRVLGPTTRPLVTAIQATWLAGATLVVLPLPMRLASIEEFVAPDPRPHPAAPTSPCVAHRPRARRRSSSRRRAIRRWCCSTTWPPTAGRSAPTATTARPTTPTRLAVLQFTSGSTSEPKGVMLPEPRDLRQPRRDRARPAACRADDVIVSWLPLYHDMGLVGLLHAAHDDRHRPRARRAAGLPRRRRSAGCEWLSDHRRHGDRRPELLVGARHPRPAAHGRGARPVAAAHRAQRRRARRSADASRRSSPRPGRFGMRPGAVFPAFGMAEVAIAGTFPDPLTGLRTDVGRPPGARARALRRARRPLGAERHAQLRGARPAGPRSRDPHRRSRRRARALRRSRGRRARDHAAPRSRPATTATPEATADAVPRRLAAHRRPRLPGRRRARRVRSHQGRDHRRRPQRLPRGRRAGRRRDRRRARRQRDRVRRRGRQGQGGARRRGRDPQRRSRHRAQGGAPPGDRGVGVPPARGRARRRPARCPRPRRASSSAACAASATSPTSCSRPEPNLRGFHAAARLRRARSGGSRGRAGSGRRGCSSPWRW